MSINLEPKFSAGELVWGVFSPTEVTFDDRLPIVELKVENVRFSGCIYGDDKPEVNFHYDVEELSGWNTHRVSETELFKDKGEAEKKALILTKAAAERFENKHQQALKMLGSQTGT